MPQNILLWVVSLIAAIIFIYLAFGFNSLIILRSRVENAWFQIDTQLKTRFDLIPDLVKVVRSSRHEQKTLKRVIDARALMIKAGSLKERAEAENMLTEALKALFDAAENYPRLKANKNFLMLQKELFKTEIKISYARQFYNESATKLNRKIHKFPTNVFARLFGFEEKEYFKA